MADNNNNNNKIEIQKELEEMCQIKKYLAHDLLEAYIEYAALYSKKCWFSLQEEYLRRMEYEISII